MRIDLPVDPALRAGMFGRALLPGDATPTLSVPASALQRAGQVTSVFVVEGDVARRRMVVAGATLPDDRVELLSGIAAGERVVVAPPATLNDGAPVREGGTQ